jgi:RNA polymerase sigma factor (sigma-70 family)
MDNGQFDAAIRRILCRDPAGLREIYEAYNPAVYAVALSVTGQPADAQDAAAETFLRIWQKADSYRPGQGHRAWLMTVARHAAVDQMRKRIDLPADEGMLEAVQDTGDLEKDIGDRMALEQALEGLKPEEKQVVALHLIADLPLREVSRVLGQPMGTVAWRYRTAVGKLRHSLVGKETGI